MSARLRLTSRPTFQEVDTPLSDQPTHKVLGDVEVVGGLLDGQQVPGRSHRRR